jgi:hypothetical protein
MGEILAIGAGIVLLQELVRMILDRASGHSSGFPKIRAKNIAVRFFTILTFPFVLFMYLVAAIWLLPYLLLSKTYRSHLKSASHLHRETGEFPDQFSELAVPDFLILPFKPIFSFMNWLGQKQSKPRRSKAVITAASDNGQNLPQ